MGLDVIAYKQMELVETMGDINAYEEKYGWPTDTTYIYPGLMRPGWTDGLAEGGVYRYVKEHSFRAGSYSGYNEWRAWLCKLALGVTPREVWKNAKQYEGKPFYKLINFSDCEGYISAEVARRLYGHFVTFQPKVDALDCEQWFKDKYADWRKAFEFAAQSGCVDFH